VRFSRSLFAAFALALGLVTAPLPAAAAEPGNDATRPSVETPHTVVLADLGLHIVALGVQRVVTPHIGLQASAGLYVPWTQTKNTFGVSGDDHAADTSGRALRTGDPRGGMIRLRPFFYLGEQALRGLWLSPFVQGGFVTADRAGVSRTGPAAALGGSVGYAWLVAQHLHLALGAGVQVHAAKVPGGEGFPSFGQVFPQIEIAVGWGL
jgi:hypothetical protein